MKDVAFSADGIRVTYEVHGSGAPALVFVHGWSCDRSYWSGQLDHFAERHQVIAIDLAGHGESSAGRQSWTMPAFGEDVVAVVERLGLGSAVLIGHSMGGDVIVEAALRLPGRVAGLVWVDVYRSLGEPNTQDDIQKFLGPFRADFHASARDLVRRMFLPSSDAALADRVVAGMSARPPEIALDALEHAISNEGPVIAALRTLTVPVTAINPDDGPTDVDGLGRHGVQAVLMSGVDHFLMMEDPDTFNRLLGEAIEEFRAVGKRRSAG